MENARASSSCHIGQRELFAFVLPDVLARLENKRRFCVALLQHNLVRQRRELISEKCKQSHGGIVFVWWNERSFLPCFANLTGESHSAPLQFAAHLRGLRSSRCVTQHRADAQVSNDLGPQIHWNCCFS